MAGFNKNALMFSQDHLPGQIQAVYDTLPYVVRIDLSHASSGDPNAEDLFADYILGIDGHAYDKAGNHYSLSFKSRFVPEDDRVQDLRLEAIKLTDSASRKNNKSGFIFGGERYAFTGYADINVQWLDGKNYVFLGTELQALEIFFGQDDNELVTSIENKYSYDREGKKFFSGRYYVFVDKERFCKCISWFCKQRVNYQNKAGETDA